MTSVSIDIAEEFLRSPNTQVRKNSLAALTVIGEEKAAELIAKTALFDDDWDVRQRAKTELLYRLVRNGRFIPPAVKSLLIAALKNDETPKRAYAILGDLKSKGFYIPRVRITLGKRLRLPSTLYFSIYTNRNWSFCLRKWDAGLVGTLLGSIPLLIYVWKQGVGLSTALIAAASIILGFALLGTLISLFATQFLTPISMHLRAVPASVFQIVVTFLNVLVGTLILQFVLVFVVGSFIEYLAVRAERSAVFIPVFAFLAAFARLGSILTFGRFKFLNKSSVRKRNLVVQTLGGTLLAFTIPTAIYLAITLSQSSYERVVSTNVWLGLLPIAVGLAAAFASIDNEAPPVEFNTA